MAASLYAKAADDKLDEIIRLAEARLSAQLTLAVAADQRAMTFSSFLAAVVAASIAAIVTLKIDHHTHYSLIALMVGAAVAAVFSLFAAQPVAWDIPGGRPGLWLEDIADGDTLHNGRAAMAEFYDQMILDNDAALASNANALRGAFISLVFALIIAGLLALLIG